MKRNDQLNELRSLDPDGLGERISAAEKELLNLRFRQASGQLDQTARLALLRRQIARAKTILRQNEQ